MPITGTNWRRWLGVLALGIAVLMLTVGDTWLKGRLSLLGFALYWSLCFLATGVAICLAFSELRAIRRDAREQKRALFESTLQEIEKESRERQNRKQ